MTADASLREPVESERAAFLRGIEHRGRVLAEAQCGNPALARALVAECKIGFHQLAEDVDPSQWPSLFWQSLLARPAMRTKLTPDARNPFSQLDPGPRAALLLRLVAEFDPPQAAEVLSVSPETCRHALFRALETLRAKGIDDATLHYVRDSLRRDARPTHAYVAAGEPVAPRPTGIARIARRFRPALMALAAAMFLALTVSFFWVPAFLRGTETAQGFQPLREHAPAATLTSTEATIASADFDLLIDPKGERTARDLDLFAWYAATSNVAASGSNANPSLPETTLPETTAPEADAEDAPEGASATNDSGLPVVTGRPVPASPKAASGKDGDAHH
jgi:hypothetical protein